jgi:hypothetical protein
MVVAWQRPWMVSKETKVQTLIPMVVFWMYVDHMCVLHSLLHLIADHTIIVYRLCVFKKKNNNNFVNKISTSKTTTCCIND